MTLRVLNADNNLNDFKHKFGIKNNISTRCFSSSSNSTLLTLMQFLKPNIDQVISDSPETSLTLKFQINEETDMLLELEGVVYRVVDWFLEGDVRFDRVTLPSAVRHVAYKQEILNVL